MKTYSNRFASMEKQPCGGWIVFNEISGLPIYIDEKSDFPQEKIYRSYAEAREVMLMLTERAKTISRGGNIA